MKKIFILLFIFFFFINFSIANEAKCPKFDVKCKAKKFIDKTTNFQKEGIEDSKEQINISKKKLEKAKEKIKENLPKTN